MKKVAFALTALTLSLGSAYAGNLSLALGQHDDAPVQFDASRNVDVKAAQVVSAQERFKLGLSNNDVVTVTNFGGDVVASGFAGER